MGKVLERKLSMHCCSYDTTFGDAVYRAAQYFYHNGLGRGDLLAQMLIAREELMADERKVLADLVSGLLYNPVNGRPRKAEKPETIEEAVHDVARWLKPRGGKSERSNLARAIMEAPLGAGEITMLADLVGGYLYPYTKGRRIGKFLTHTQRLKLFRMYRKLKKRRVLHKENLQILVSQFRIGRKTVEAYITSQNHRATAVKDSKYLLSWNKKP
ncbi:MAG TPA: hypothetical protein VFT64_01685 [Rickettsiales bacterium]|nr:hypothetical protein [Rickettsiales bacterium]